MATATESLVESCAPKAGSYPTSVPPLGLRREQLAPSSITSTSRTRKRKGSPERGSGENSFKLTKLTGSAGSELPWERGDSPKPPSSTITSDSVASSDNPSSTEPPLEIDLSMVKPPLGPPPSGSAAHRPRQSSPSLSQMTDPVVHVRSPTAATGKHREFPLSSLMEFPSSSPYTNTKHKVDPMLTSIVSPLVPGAARQGSLSGLSSLADVCQEVSLSRRSSFQANSGVHSPTNKSGADDPTLRDFSWSPNNSQSRSPHSSTSTSPSLLPIPHPQGLPPIILDHDNASAAKEYASHTVLMAQNRSKNWAHIVLNTFAQKAASLNAQISEVSLSGDDINKYIDLNWASVSTGFRRSRTWKSTVRATLHRSDLFRHTKYGWTVHDCEDPPPLADRMAEGSKDRLSSFRSSRNEKGSISSRTRSHAPQSNKHLFSVSSALRQRVSCVAVSGSASSLVSHQSTQSIEYWKSYAGKIATRLLQKKRLRRSSICSTGSTLSNPGYCIQDLRPDQYLVTRARSVSHQVPLRSAVAAQQKTLQRGNEQLVAPSSHLIIPSFVDNKISRGTLSVQLQGAAVSPKYAAERKFSQFSTLVNVAQSPTSIVAVQ